MGKIVINHTVSKEETLYGSLKIDEVIFDANEMEEFIYKYVLTKENLEYIFCDKVTKPRDYFLMIKRFLPSETVLDIEKYVDDKTKENKAFYSFFAEALLPIAYKDVYGYSLQEAAIGITQTLTDTNSGVDGCLYDSDKNVFVIGEAKFYKSFCEGISNIIDDFTEKGSVANKLDSLYKKMMYNKDMDCIILKKLGKNETRDYSLNEFLKLKIGLAGFVLHEDSSIDLANINNDDFYDKYPICSDDIFTNILKNGLDISGFNCTITIFHFIIHSKRDLIIKCIKYASKIKEEIMKNE